MCNSLILNIHIEEVPDDDGKYCIQHDYKAIILPIWLVLHLFALGSIIAGVLHLQFQVVVGFAAITGAEDLLNKVFILDGTWLVELLCKLLPVFLSFVLHILEHFYHRVQCRILLSVGRETLSERFELLLHLDSECFSR